MKKLLMCSAILLTACGSQPKIDVSSTQYGDKWPLTVEKGTLICEKPKRIVFTTPDGKKFGVNGSASIDHPSILEITKDVNDTGMKYKMDVSTLISDGLKLCEP